LKKLIAAIAAAAALAAPAAVTLATGTPAQAATTCGVWRWPVKTASDADRYQISSATYSTSVSYLRGLAKPVGFTSYAQDHRIAWPERRMWIIYHTHLVQYRLEDDGDIHLVLRNGSGQTMIAEIPNPSCVPSWSRYGTSIAASRHTFTTRDPAATSWHYVYQQVTVRGPGFFDEEHTVTGQAPNGLELHPLTGFWFG
jgi:hypothetical protein